MRRLLLLITALAILIGAITGVGYLNAVADPAVRPATIRLPRWPADTPPLRVVLLSDLHIGNAGTGTERLARVVDQVNGLRPDLVLIAGDFFPGEAPVDAARATVLLAPLGALRARLGVLAAPGNHDHWTGLAAVRTALAAAGVQLLANTAQVRGPIVVGAVDDVFSGHADVRRVVAVARRLPGARLILTHSPDVAAVLPAGFPLLLAGHTHCGQIVLPFFGSLADDRYYARRYRCGLIREGARAVIVTSGLGGTVPLRLGARPDLWLLTLGP